MPVSDRFSDTTQTAPTTTDPIAAQKELARRTAEKIDQIESEMMSPDSQAWPDSGRRDTEAAPTTTTSSTRGGTTFVTPRSTGARTPGSAAPGELPGRPPPPLPEPPALDEQQDELHGLPSQELSTSVVLGDTYVGFGGIEVSTSSLPPELEEAAILFANAQVGACIATLKVAIGQEMPPEWQRQGWLMLLDVLQATGDRTGFDALALEFARHFEQSPPTWRQEAAGATQAVTGSGAATIRFTDRLDQSSAKQFEQGRRNAASGRSVTMDFGRLTGCDADGAAMACEFFRQCEASACDLAIIGVDRLLQVALAGIEVGRRDPNDAVWKLALAVYRMLERQQQFEDLTIDYAVTFEISPPPWVPPADKIRLMAAGDAKAADASDHESVADAGLSGAKGSVFMLGGELTGRMSDELDALRAYADQHSEIVIDCRNLRRMDFVAAGELLNEVVALAGRGLTVLFVEPSSIVEALFIVMGLHEVADIRGRKI